MLSLLEGTTWQRKTQCPSWFLCFAWSGERNRIDEKWMCSNKNLGTMSLCHCEIISFVDICAQRSNNYDNMYYLCFFSFVRVKQCHKMKYIWYLHNPGDKNIVIITSLKSHKFLWIQLLMQERIPFSDLITNAECFTIVPRLNFEHPQRMSYSSSLPSCIIQYSLLICFSMILLMVVELEM